SVTSVVRVRATGSARRITSLLPPLSCVKNTTLPSGSRLGGATREPSWGPRVRSDILLLPTPGNPTGSPGNPTRRGFPAWITTTPELPVSLKFELIELSKSGPPVQATSPASLTTTTSSNPARGPAANDAGS